MKAGFYSLRKFIQAVILGLLIIILLTWAFYTYLQPDLVLNFATLLKWCGITL